MINIHQLELPLSRTYFHGSEGVRAIEVVLYLVKRYILYCDKQITTCVNTAIKYTVSDALYLLQIFSHSTATIKLKTKALSVTDILAPELS